MSLASSLPNVYRQKAIYGGQNFEGSHSWRTAYRTNDKIRVGDQLESRETARPRNPTHAARPRRRGDRLTLGALLPAPPTNFSEARAIRGTSQKLQPPS